MPNNKGLDVISTTCYISNCSNKASNKHIRGDYVIFVCNDHNIQTKEGCNCEFCNEEEQFKPITFSFTIECDPKGKRIILKKLNKFLNNTNWNYKNVKGDQI